MSKNTKMLKKWWNIAEIKKSTFVFQLIYKLTHAAFFVIAPIFSAKVVVRLTLADYKGAIFYLSIVFAMLILRNFVGHLSYINYGKLTGDSYMILQKRIIGKILDAKQENFNKNKKEKLLNIYHAAAYNVSIFSDTLTIGISKLLRLLITVIIIVTINIYVAILIVAIDIINYFILNFLYNKVANTNKSINEMRDVQNEKFCEIFDAKDVLSEMKLRKKTEQRYYNFSQRISDKYGDRQIWQSHIDNTYFVYFNAVVYIVTLVLITLISKGSMTLENYLIVVPYLLTGITDANEFFDMFVALKNTDVSVNRIKTIEEFSPRDLIEFGSNNCDEITGSVDFYNVSFKSPRTATEKLPQLKNVNFHIQENENTLILGSRGCGKRTIFYLLRRLVSPDEGNIYISGANAKEYTQSVYKNNFTFCTSNPMFLSGSITKNLRLVETSTNKIHKVTKDLGIYDDIMKLKKKFGSDPTKLPADMQYLLNLARSILTKSEIIVLYEFQSSLSEKQKNRISEVLKNIKDERTIITFSASEFCTKFSNKIIEIDDGEVKNIYFNNV